jgi:hypothetical protein
MEFLRQGLIWLAAALVLGLLVEWLRNSRG